MPSNITKAFKRKSALRGLVDGGRVARVDRLLESGAAPEVVQRAAATPYPENAPIPPLAPPTPPNAQGLGADATANFNANVRALGTEEGRTAFNERNIATNTGLRASWDDKYNVPLLTGAPSNIDTSRGLGVVGGDQLAPGNSGGGTVSFMPDGTLAAAGQAGLYRAHLDNMRDSLRTGDLGAFDSNNARLGALLASPGALSGGVLPSTPAAPAAPAALAAPAAPPLTLEAMAEKYNRNPNPALGLPPTGDSAFDDPLPMTPAQFAGTGEDWRKRVAPGPSTMGHMRPPAGAARTIPELGSQVKARMSEWFGKADGGRIHPRGLADGGKPTFLNYTPLALNTRPRPTPEQEQRNFHTIGNVLMDLVPGSGIADALGHMPDLKGGTRPSMKANIQSGQYGPAVMQGLSAGGDALLIGGTGLRLAKNAIKHTPDLIRAGMVGNLGEAGAGAIVNYGADYGMRSGGRIHPRGLRADNSGRVEGPGGPTDDKVGPVMLSDDEYVLPADTAKAIGYENLDAIKDATHTPVKEKKGLRGMADGGRLSGREANARLMEYYAAHPEIAAPPGFALAAPTQLQPQPESLTERGVASIVGRKYGTVGAIVGATLMGGLRGVAGGPYGIATGAALGGLAAGGVGYKSGARFGRTIDNALGLNKIPPLVPEALNRIKALGPHSSLETPIPRSGMADGGKVGLRGIPGMYGGGRPPTGFQQHVQAERALQAQLQAQQAAGPIPGQVHGPAHPIPGQVHGPARPVVPPSGTVGYTPDAAAPAAPSKGLGGWGRAGLGLTAIAEGMRGMGDYNTLTEAGEIGHGPQAAFESASRIGGAVAGAKAGAMLPLVHPYARGAAIVGGGALGFAAPDLIAGMAGHETARKRANAFRDERASEMNLNEPAEQAPPQPQQEPRAPSQMMYADGTPYLADPGRVHMRPDMGGSNQIPSGARDINQRFDALAAEIQKKHGLRVTTPFGTRTLDRTNRLLELEQARAQALASNTNAMVNQRGQDMSAREAGLRAAGAGGGGGKGKGDSDADMLKELRLAQEKDMERQEKIAEQLWTEAERASGDNENMPTEQLYRFMTQSQGFMNQYMGASPAKRKALIAEMRDGYAEYAARQKRGLRFDTAVEPGLVAPVGMRRGASWDDVNKDRATWGDFLIGNPTGRQMVDYGNQLVPLRDIHRMNPERKGQINADILRRIGVTE